MKLSNVMILGLVFVFFLSSCDKEHVKDYYVVNKIGKSIGIEHQVWGKSNSFDNILPNDTVLIYSDVYYEGTVGVDDDRLSDAISDLNVICGERTIEINESSWRYDKVGTYHAEYYLFIDSTLLEIK
ncbi:MAG: hypothetical protein V2I54_04535 [Bacteroidales bacterium]|nr:hypothetical protein [Bacteroidales bacterium]